MSSTIELLIEATTGDFHEPEIVRIIEYATILKTSELKQEISSSYLKYVRERKKENCECYVTFTGEDDRGYYWKNQMLPGGGWKKTLIDRRKSIKIFETKNGVTKCLF